MLDEAWMAWLRERPDDMVTPAQKGLELARRGAAIDIERGIAMASYSREVLPSYFLGDWDHALDHASSSRKAWLDEGRPPMGAFATPAASAAAIHGYRGDLDAFEEWLTHAKWLAASDTEQNGGVRMMAADTLLHLGEFDKAARITEQATVGSQWTAPYAATRAEAFARASQADAAEAIEFARARVGEHRYAEGILLRARGLREDQEEHLREWLAMFEQMECRYQAARSGWLLGGDARERARETFERLVATLPAE
jgi:tetratricopeptide (TPR) repeat protein